MNQNRKVTSANAIRQREKRLCPYVYLCGDAKESTRNKLDWQTRAVLANGGQVGYVDPCVRPAGHPGEHILSSMYYDPAMDGPLPTQDF